MNYDRFIEVDFDNCEIVSRFVESEEIIDPSTFGIWMFENRNKLSKTEITYVVYYFENIKYISDALFQNLDLIRLKLFRKKTTKIYMKTSDNSYFFDLEFLKNE